MRAVVKIWEQYIILYFLLALVAAVNYLNNWPIVQFFQAKQEKDFGDAEIILNAADCFSRIGLKVYSIKKGDCSYNYGESLIRMLDFLGLNNDSVNVIGIVFIFLLISTFIESLRLIQPKATFKIHTMATIFFISPPMMLLMERGNFDALIFSLVVFSIILESRGRYISAATILIISTLFKFYTFPALVNCYLRNKHKTKSNKIWKFLITIVLLMVAHDLYRISKGFTIPNPMWFAFGSSKLPWVFSRIIGIEFSRGLQIFLGAILIFLLYLLLEKFQKNLVQFRKLKIACQKEQGKSYTTLVSLNLIFILNYLTGMSYIYRLIFAIPIFIFLIIIQKKFWTLTNCLIFTSTFIFFISPWFGRLELIGDICLFFLVGLLVWIYIPRVSILISLGIQSKKILN